MLNYSATLSGHSGPVTDLAVLNNGYLASASLDGTTRVWDASYNSSVTEAHSKAVLALKALKNGSLISSSFDTTVKTWDTDHFVLKDTLYKEN